MSVNKKELLGTYLGKRKRGQTPEPWGPGSMHRPGAFAVQKHAARSLHYDLRLEWGGVLWSWAVPKGISQDTAEKRLAIRTEDHPVEYLDFEGVIPEGNYGAGAMILWDRGRWLALEDPQTGIEKGKLLFELFGYKLRGIWTLVRSRKNEQEWLLIKKPDGWARPDQQQPHSDSSVLSGLTVEQLGEGYDPLLEIRQQLASGRLPSALQTVGEVELMLAQTADKAFSRDGWLFEIKYDGYRLLAGRRGQRVQLRYRGGLDATPLFPELTRALIALPAKSFILDGELVVLDEWGKPSFQMLQQRGHRRAAVQMGAGMVEFPATLFAFDLLMLEGSDLRSLPLTERKELLRRVLPPTGPVRYSEHWERNGEKLFQEANRLGFEGIVAKKANSPYRAGRWGDWLKIHADQVGNFVIVGFTLPRGSRAGFGALHLALFEGDKLIYSGRVGSGFSEEQLQEIRHSLEDLRRDDSPCRGAPSGENHRWVEPELVCSVRYKETTSAGQLRQPRFLGLSRLPPSDCRYAGVQQPSVNEADAEEQAPSVSFSNLEKIFWPEEGYSKGDLVEYYRRIGPWILPYLKDRPLVLDRYPDGITGKSFFQKNAPDFSPSWVRTEQIWGEDETRGNDYFVCDRLEALLYIANLASIPLHVWSSRIESIEHPDWSIIDLDPKGALFQNVAQVARAIYRLCRKAGIDSFVKTSGGEGLHVLIPLGAQYSHEQSRLIAELISRIIAQRLPEIATVERNPEARGGKVYLDYLQNGRGKLLAAPFCVRPRKCATVSTPLRWSEVTTRLDVSKFTIRTLPKRMRRLKEDPMAPLLSASVDLEEALQNLHLEVSHPG